MTDDPGTQVYARFVRYSLRTLDVPAARAFYAEALGIDLPLGPASGAIEVWPLHERARSLGVPAHWLGQVGVDDPEAIRDTVVARGGAALGPIVEGPHGRYATLRDPGGAVFAASTSRAVPGPSPVAWHHLHTTDLGAAQDLYTSLFRWASKGISPRGDRAFSWSPNGPEVGSMAEIASQEIHPHWLFFLPVGDVHSASTRIREAGGRAFSPVLLDSGRSCSACEDPQGAAFGILSAV